MPDVEFERAGLREPQQRRQVVAQQVLVALVLVLREHGDRLDELRPLLLPVLLEEALPADAVGHADHGERTIGEMRQHERRDLREVAQQVALGERRLLQRRIRGPVDAVEMREADLVRADRERERGLRCFPAAPRLRRSGCRRARSPSARRCRGCGLGATHGLRIDVVAQAQEHRRAQGTVLGPALEAHLGDDFGLDPGRRAHSAPALRRTGRCFVAAAPAAP